jgi:chloramphenicol O-acetyltransferase type A
MPFHFWLPQAHPIAPTVFSSFPFKENFSEFAQLPTAEIARVKAGTGLEMVTQSQAVIYYTTIPWLSFTQIVHPDHDGFKSTIPKIAFGKIFKSCLDSMIPVSVSVHHALMDGYHVGKFYEILQELFDSDIT